MFSAMHYIFFNEGLSDVEGTVAAIQQAAEEVTPVNLVAVPHESTNFGGTNLICRLAFADQDEYEAAKAGEGWANLDAILTDPGLVAKVEFAAYGDGYYGVDAPDATDCVHRVLMFAEQERAKPEDVEQLTQLCTQFHKYVPGMLNWRVADVVESSGTKQWAHIWEQDFDSVETFQGIYMLTPFHPTLVDTYFDTECPNWVADPELLTVTCDEKTAFLANFA